MSSNAVRSVVALGVVIASMLGGAVTADDSESSARRVQMINATGETVNVTLRNALGNAISFCFNRGNGRYEPVPLSSGLGDRLLSAWKVDRECRVTLPGKLLATSSFGPSNVNTELLQITLVKDAGEYSFIYTTASESDEIGEAFTGRAAGKSAKLTEPQKEAIGKILQQPPMKLEY